MGRQAQPLFPCGPCHSPLEKRSGAEGVEMYTHCVHNTERGRIDLRWLCTHTHTALRLISTTFIILSLTAICTSRNHCTRWDH